MKFNLVVLNLNLKDFMPHLQSVLRNCFLLSIGTLGGEGRGEGETLMFQYSSCSHPELYPV